MFLNKLNFGFKRYSKKVNQIAALNILIPVLIIVPTFIQTFSKIIRNEIILICFSFLVLYLSLNIMTRLTGVGLIDKYGGDAHKSRRGWKGFSKEVVKAILFTLAIGTIIYLLQIF